MSTQWLKDKLIEHEGEFENVGNVVEDSDWISDGKYDYRTVVLLIEDSYYRVGRSRSGSYYSGWEYDDDYFITEVEPYTKTVTKYRKKNESSTA